MRRARAFAAVLAAALVLSASFSASWSASGLNAAGLPTFPQRIGGLVLACLDTRDKAKDDLNSIHDERIEVASAAIAHYEGAQGSAVVWWSRAGSAKEAQSQLERMVAKIDRSVGSGTFPYSGHRTFKRAGLTVHSFLGHGQTHYTYARGDEVWWVQAPAALVESVFDAVMKK